MKYLLILITMFGFLVTYYLTPWVIRFTKRIGLNVKDQNKKNTPLIPLSGGFAVIAGIYAGVMITIFIQTFIYNSTKYLVFLLAGINTILIITLVGFIDDLLIRKDKETSTGLKQWQKPLLTLTAAVPLMAINLTTTGMNFPFLGKIELGLIYPLILIPIGVVGAANMVNMLEGYNGLATGMGIVYTGMLGLYAFVNGRQPSAIIALITLGALLAFFIYNKTPAKILPGDSLTYLLGGTLATIAILGDMEKAAIIVAIPFIIEFFLKARSKFKADSFGYYKDGKIQSKYKKIYSLPHIFTRTGKYTEKQVVLFMILIEIVFASLIWFV